jgi:hypothetical protein
MTGIGSSSWNTSIIGFRIRPKPETDIKLSALLSPSSCEEICNNQISPVILVSNLGRTTVDKLLVNYSVNDSEKKTWEWTGILNIDSDVNIQLPAMTIPYGKQKLAIWIELPNGKSDFNSKNDSIIQTIQTVTPQTIPFFEGAESGTILPDGWLNITNGSSNLRWRNTTNASYEGSHSFIFDNFNNNEPGKYGLLVTPNINEVKADSLELSFNIAAAMYDENKIDTLEVIIKTECGQQQQTVYKKWGTGLSTINRLSTQAFVPLKNEWRKEVISLNAWINKPFRITFKATNQFGNNIYLDAIHLQSFNYPEIDLSAEKILLPPDSRCSNNLTPAIIITNKGKNITKSASIELLEDNQLIEKINWTGNLSTFMSDTVYFKSIIAKSAMTLKAVIHSVNDIKDENSLNDTILYTYKAAEIIPLPYLERFEEELKINRWIVYGDTTSKWKKIQSGFNSVSSLSVNNFGMPVGSSSIISPKFTWKTADSIWLEFQFAAGYRTDFPSDSLKVDISFDCGKYWNNIFNKYGLDLATKFTSTPFLPITASDWKTVRLNLTRIAFGKNEMLIRITNSSNGNNSIFIDQLNIYTKDVSADLKKKGYQVLPNPIKDHLMIQLYPYAVGLTAIKLTDVAGRIHYLKGFKEEANIQQHFIDFSNLSAGIYFVTLQFRDKVITEKIIKLNP